MTALDKFDFSAGLTPDVFRAFFVHCYRHGVSDIHLQSNAPLVLGHHGRKIRASAFTLDHSSLLLLIDFLFSPLVKARIQGGKGDDAALQLEGDSQQRYGLERGERIRFRANFTQATIRGVNTAIAVTLRVINNHIPALNSLGLPDPLYQTLAHLPVEGIGLVVGPTGSGKTTLLSSVYQHHGETDLNSKVTTYEDPVETLLGGPNWLLQPQQCEIGRDVPSYAEGLRLSMRQAPTIIGIGEVRDGETTEGMVSSALSGHLCLGTEHAFSAGHAFARSIRMLSPENREPLAHDMLELMRFIVMQRLVPTTDGRQRALQEYVLFDDELRESLRQHEYTQWASLLTRDLARREARISDHVWKMYREESVTEDIARSYIGASEFIKRSQRHVR
ncbi:plasmid transfer ATPase TraJ [Salmonella enterica subsp. enterica]|nr:plasmid transfer ATPase TraJ [Salmonella enterica subsp. enterica serovar Brandenburg]EBG6926351.1 plasmid transfer ATPase TraJ [Salmonella enterica subsp. enterica]ECN6007699.1 plasmid transfer ATPase TraJ [Salmonella enterica subsp. enterica serovar Brandenburg]EIP2213755.1 plasmid transfer ATPase TraJ [Salmonella enterica subsp. enterica serovar Schwarzengrund]